MKRVIVGILLLCMCLSLCACGKSEKAQAVDDLILSIGDVTLLDKSVITLAKIQYDELKEREKQSVENYKLLEEAINTLAVLEEEEAKEKARLKEEEEKRTNNYLKVLQWIADNGEAIYNEDDVNSYGQVERYSYTFKDSAGRKLDVWFFAGTDGGFDEKTELILSWWEVPRDEIYDAGLFFELSHGMKIDYADSNVEYDWNYKVFQAHISKTVSIARGGIEADNLSTIEKASANYEIKNYEAVSSFKETSGLTDVRSAINKDFTNTLDKFNLFLLKKLSMELKDIGFTAY